MKKPEYFGRFQRSISINIIVDVSSLNLEGFFIRRIPTYGRDSSAIIIERHLCHVIMAGQPHKIGVPWNAALVCLLGHCSKLRGRSNSLGRIFDVNFEKSFMDQPAGG